MKKSLIILLVICLAMVLTFSLVACNKNKGGDQVSIQSIEVTQMPTKLEYEQGENISLEGLKVKVTFSDGKTEEIAVDKLNITKPATTDVGEKEVKIAYTVGDVTKEASFKINVKHKHVYDQQKVDAAYLKTAATCTAKAVYYKSCKCGEKGADTFIDENSTPLGHDIDFTIGENFGKCKREGCTYTAVTALTTEDSGKDNEFNLIPLDDTQYVTMFSFETGICADYLTIDTKTIEDGAVVNYLYSFRYFKDGAYSDVYESIADDIGYMVYISENKLMTNSKYYVLVYINDEEYDAEENDYKILFGADFYRTTHTFAGITSEKNPTCTEPGNEEYYACQSCGKKFKEDGEGNKIPLALNEEVRPALGHDYSFDSDATFGTCQRDGCTENSAVVLQSSDSGIDNVYNILYDAYGTLTSNLIFIKFTTGNCGNKLYISCHDEEDNCAMKYIDGFELYKYGTGIGCIPSYCYQEGGYYEYVSDPDGYEFLEANTTYIGFIYISDECLDQLLTPNKIKMNISWYRNAHDIQYNGQCKYCSEDLGQNTLEMETLLNEEFAVGETKYRRFTVYNDEGAKLVFDFDTNKFFISTFNNNGEPVFEEVDNVTKYTFERGTYFINITNISEAVVPDSEQVYIACQHKYTDFYCFCKTCGSYMGADCSTYQSVNSTEPHFYFNAVDETKYLCIRNLPAGMYDFTMDSSLVSCFINVLDEEDDIYQLVGEIDSSGSTFNNRIVNPKQQTVYIVLQSKTNNAEDTMLTITQLCTFESGIPIANDEYILHNVTAGWHGYYFDIPSTYTGDIGEIIVALPDQSDFKALYLYDETKNQFIVLSSTYKSDMIEYCIEDEGYIIKGEGEDPDGWGILPGEADQRYYVMILLDNLVANLLVEPF